MATAVKQFQSLKPATIDKAAQAYLVLKLEEEVLEKRMSEAREHLLQMIEERGITPSKAEKSKRLTGEMYTVTATFGQTTSIDQFSADSLRAHLETYQGGAGFFERLFTEETKYSLNKDAISVISGKLPKGIHGGRVRALFQKALRIKDKNPSLCVEEINPEQKRA